MAQLLMCDGATLRRCEGAFEGARCDDATVHHRTDCRTLHHRTFAPSHFAPSYFAPSHFVPAHFVIALFAIVLWWPGTADAQRARGRRPAPAPAPPPIVTEPAAVECPSPLGEGVQTRRLFCDVLAGRDPAAGIIIRLPPHTGDVTLTFDLHNRHTYSEELIKTNRAYRHYTATIGVLTADNTLLSRAVVQNEFRTAADLIDRVSGGAGPGGLKAVAPTGSEAISITIPAEEETVSILGEKLAVIRADATTPDNFTAPGRPIAVISNVMLHYRPPAPVRRSAPRR